MSYIMRYRYIIIIITICASGIGFWFYFILPFSFATLGSHKILLSPASHRFSCAYIIYMFMKNRKIFQKKEKNKTSARVVFRHAHQATSVTTTHHHTIWSRSAVVYSETGHDKSHASGHAILYIHYNIYICT